MSVRAIDRVWKSDLTDPRELLTMLALADWADDDGECYPKLNALAEKSRQSRRNLKYVLDKLRKKGAVEWEPGVGRGNPNRYQILFDNLSVDDKGCNIDAPFVSEKEETQAAPFKEPEKVQPDEEKVQDQPTKGAKLSHTRGEPSVEPSIKRKTLSNKQHKAGCTPSQGSAREASEHPFHAQFKAEEKPPELAHLSDVKVPLSEQEIQQYGKYIKQVWDSVPRGEKVNLFMVTFGKTSNGSYGPRGLQQSIFADLCRKYPWEWLVPICVVTSAKAQVNSAENFAKVWLEKLRPVLGSDGPVPFSGSARASPRKLEPPPKSISTTEMEADMDTFGLEEGDFKKHDTNQGDRWTLTETGERRKRERMQAMTA